MSDISKERREKLALKLRSANSVPVHDTRIKADDLRALLNMADERDRLRGLLEQATRDVRGEDMGNVWERIDEELNGRKS